MIPERPRSPWGRGLSAVRIRAVPWDMLMRWCPGMGMVVLCPVAGAGLGMSRGPGPWNAGA